MSIEKLIELKNKIESKYVSYDVNDTGDIISLFEIEQRKDERGAINNLENYLESLIIKLGIDGKKYDELSISAICKLFYRAEDIDKEDNVPLVSAKPLSDFVVISFGCYKAIYGDSVFDSDPEEIYSGCYNEFIVSFGEFKSILVDNGFGIDSIKSFADIENSINNDRVPVAFFTRKFSKNKGKIKERS